MPAFITVSVDNLPSVVDFHLVHLAPFSVQPTHAYLFLLLFSLLLLQTQDLGGSPRMSRHRGALARSRSIDHQLDEDRERRQKEIQLLLLGKWRGARNLLFNKNNIQNRTVRPYMPGLQHFLNTVSLSRGQPHSLDHLDQSSLIAKPPSYIRPVSKLRPLSL